MQIFDPLELRPGDIVVVPFPYADRLVEKKRPALVISGRRLLEKRVVWLAMVTSAENAAWPCDVPLESLERTGLRAPSVIRPWKLTTVDVTRIIRKAGSIETATLVRVMDEIARSMAD